MLLQALQDFNERIIPLFSKVETQQKDLDQKSQELTRSRRERDEIHARIAHIGPLQTEVQRLRNALSETEANTQEALSLAESAKDKLQTQCQLAEQWQKQAAALEKKNSDLHEIVQRHQSYVSPGDYFISSQTQQYLGKEEKGQVQEVGNRAGRGYRKAERAEQRIPSIRKWACE